MTVSVEAGSGIGRFCPVCGAAFEKLRPGPGGVRPEASCPSCGSLERHRLVALVLEGAAPLLAGADVLEVAPSSVTTPLIAALGPARHIRMDFDPAADGRSVTVQASLTDLPFADDSFDFALVLHVFEHIPDDRRAMRELARVLRPGGAALVQVPWSPKLTTDEDPDAGPAERIRRFGRADHVRTYGADELSARLADAGLRTVRFLSRDIADPPVMAALGLLPTEATWMVRRDPAGHGAELGPPAGLRQAVLGRVLAAGIDRERARRDSEQALEPLRQQIELLQLTMDARVLALGRRIARAEKAARDWERRYHHLRGRLPLRLAARLTAPVRRVLHANDVSWEDRQAAAESAGGDGGRAAGGW